VILTLQQIMKSVAVESKRVTWNCLARIRGIHPVSAPVLYRTMTEIPAETNHCRSRDSVWRAPGFNGVTTKEIAQSAHVSGGNIFTIFPRSETCSLRD